MAYTVLARKYRPQTFEEMVGQQPVVKTLCNELLQNRVAHAYLFCGSRGVGKTTAARLLARALNCAQGPTSRPCGECQTCIEIRDGIATDVIEIDGASNNGVENVREIRENAKYLPQSARYKIYIIDEVHMLSQAAFNALLKTLEEPPAHVKFIFATTEAQKLPDTILSRCQRHNFRHISTQAMLERLKTICGNEAISLSDKALLAISNLSKGGMRDALSLLDQLVSAHGKQPEDKELMETLGCVDSFLVQNMTRALVERNAHALLENIEIAYENGVEFKNLMEELALGLRHLFVAKTTGKLPEVLAEEEQRFVESLAKNADDAQLAYLFDAVHNTLWAVGRSAFPKLTLEMQLLKAIYLAPSLSIPALLQRLEALESASSPLSPATAGAPGGRSEQSPFLHHRHTT
ncbi:MAG: DNA polymerase III subunit gamma/tau [Cystobacterineae bacterium]|nr:DNA polymerase III subunit gamma/tau [Cystobacterineae bacterium]